MTAVRLSAALFLVAAAALAQPPKPAEVPPRPAGELPSVPAITLHRAYEDNPIAADAAYKDKWIRVTGRGKVEQGNSGNAFVFNSGTLTRGLAEIPGVYARIAKSAEPGFAKPILETDSVAVEGYCRGQANVFGAYKSIGVILDGCSLAK